MAAGKLSDLDCSSDLDPAKLDGTAEVHRGNETDVGSGNGVDVRLTEGTPVADPVGLGETAPARRGSIAGSKSPSDSTKALQSPVKEMSKGEMESSSDKLQIRRRRRGRGISTVAFRFCGRLSESEEPDLEDWTEEAWVFRSYTISIEESSESDNSRTTRAVGVTMSLWFLGVTGLPLPRTTRRSGIISREDSPEGPG